MKAKSLMTAAVLVLLLAAKTAYADTIGLRYGTDGSSWTQVTDLTVPFDVSTSNASVGIFNILSLFGQGSPALVNGLDLTSVIRTDVGGTGTLFVELSQDNLAAAPGWILQAGPVFTGSGLSLVVSAWVDDANGLFNRTTQLTSIGPINQFGAVSGSGTAAVTPPFSLTERLEFTCTNCTPGTGMTGNLLVTVPEPTTLILLGTGLLSLVWWMHRRSRRSEA